jgi:hypothetical protein
MRREEYRTERCLLEVSRSTGILACYVLSSLFESLWFAVVSEVPWCPWESCIIVISHKPEVALVGLRQPSSGLDTTAQFAKVVLEL